MTTGARIRPASTTWVAVGAFLAALLLSSTTWAHESRPAYLELTEQQPNAFDVTWRRPARGDLVLRLAPVFPSHCTDRGRRASYVESNASIERWQIDCGTGGLPGHTLYIQGLEETLTDVLVRVSFLNGATFSHILRGNAPAFTLRGEPSKTQVIRDYFILGVEHILGGVDHLLFVLCLLLIVDSVWRLIKTVTAFTVAHSITLGAATLGFVNVPQAPVEAVIALSILFLATELVRQQRGERDLAMRAPWLVAFTFGLLHGFGFAGALAEIGLPQTEIPLALLMFNVGVEAGQVIFIMSVLALIWASKRVIRAWPHWLPQVTAYGIGGISAYWVIDRVVGFW